MPKKWVPVGKSPEGRTYFAEVSVRKLKKGKTPLPPPNFPPTDEARTSNEKYPPILTNAQAVEQALENKED